MQASKAHVSLCIRAVWSEIKTAYTKEMSQSLKHSLLRHRTRVDFVERHANPYGYFASIPREMEGMLEELENRRQREKINRMRDCRNRITVSTSYLYHIINLE